MTGLNLRTVVAIVIATSSLLVAAGASARDDERWERERDRERYEHRHQAPDEHRHHYESSGRPHHYNETPVVYERRPVVVMPAPMYQAPVYAPPMDPSLNFNFNIPLR
jgi:Ni/Co efflux regulator RcnB